VGYNDASGGITNSYATGSVSGAADTGGLAGYNNASIGTSYATGAVTGSGSSTGGLVGYNDASGGITNSYATGSVSGAADTGGLAGYNNASIGTSYATGAVTGSGSYTGGLAGYNNASIGTSYATGAVTGSGSYTGGLVGYNDASGSITGSWATGAVTGSANYTGGLVGYSNGSISTSYASGAVTGSGSSTGGLVGDNEGSITDAYATGLVSGAADTGGLVGYNGSSGTVNNTYATGLVSGTAGSTGGLVGYNAGGGSLVTNSFWDIDTTGQATSAGGTGKGTPDLFAQATYTGAWSDFGSTWYMIDGETRPFLQMEYSTSIHNSHQLQLMVMNPAASYTLANDIDMSELTNASGHWKTSSYPASISTELGFVPVGNYYTQFTGSLAGNGYAVNGMYIDRPNTDYVGLFGYVGGNGTVSGVGMLGGSVTGRDYTGGLVGDNNVPITNSYATGTVTGRADAGGLVGYNGNGGTITTSYASGAVTATGNYAGGLVGENDGTVTNTYATGAVTGASCAGGLVGYNTGTINTSYASGAVSGAAGFTGGLVGYGSGTVNNSLWDTDTTGQSTSAGGAGAVGTTTDQLMTKSTYTSAGWDFGSTWYMIDGETRPFLQMEYSTSIQNSHQLQLMVMNPAASYTLANDIDMSELTQAAGHWKTSSYPANISTELGFVPVGSASTPFTGSLAGNGYTINNMYIDRPNTDYVGLFGYIGATGTVTNVGLTGGSVTGQNYVGALAGENDGSITNSYATSQIAATADYVGGLVGYNNGVIASGYATGDVSATGDCVGGLAGYNNVSITRSYATGVVSATGDYAGGLTGYNNGAISLTYATGGVSGANNVGGLVGCNFGGITESYATGGVSATGNFAGGLVGYSSGVISETYATGGATGADYVGGLVGYNTNDGKVSTSYAAGPVTGSGSNVGLVFGADDAGTTGNSPETTGAMTHLATFSAWGTNIDASGGTTAIWRIYEGYTDPLLRTFLTEATATVNNSTQVYDGTTSVAGSCTWSIKVDPSEILGTPVYTAAGRNAGNQSVTLTGLYSTQQGYDISTVNGTVDITAANLTISTPNVTKTYDGTTSASGTAVVTAGTLFGTDSISGGSFAFTNKNAGIGNKTVTVSGVTVSDGNSGNNYSVTYANNTTSTINQANLTISTPNVTKTYDGTTSASGTAIVTSGTLYGTDSISSGSFAFTDKNAGIGNKTVTVSAVTISDGNSGNNYSVTYANNTTSTINPLAITATYAAQDKVYDGTTAATVSGSSSGIIGGDTVTFSQTAAFADKNAGAGKTVNITGISLGGSDGGNYSLLSTNATATASITPKNLSITANDDAKTYSGVPYSGGNGVTYTGFVSGETGAVLGGTLAYGGTSQGAVYPGPYTITPSGLTSGNYNISFINGLLTITGSPSVVAETSAITSFQISVNSTLDQSNKGTTSSGHSGSSLGPGVGTPTLANLAGTVLFTDQTGTGGN
jgi:hypothetical protein